MSVLDALQGLVGGLGSGLNDFIGLREKQMETQNREKLTQMQLQAEARQKQAEEFDQLHSAYLAATGDLDPEMAQKFSAANLPVQKTPTGMLRRPLTVGEQAQEAQRKLVELNITDKGRQQEFLLKLQTDPNMANLTGPQLGRLAFAHGLSDRIPETPQDIEAASAAKAQGELPAQLAIENVRNAGDMGVAQMQINRAEQTAFNRDIDGPDYFLWKRKALADPSLKRFYAEAVAAGKSELELDHTLRLMYKQYRNPQPPK